MYTPFEEQRRLVARFALYVSLVVVTSMAAFYWHLANEPVPLENDIVWSETDFEAIPAVRLLQQFLRIDSSPDGDEYATALWLAAPLEAAGLSVNVERVGERQANLWTTLEGRDPSPLVLLSHLDVEKVVKPELWEHPPFAGVLSPPLLHGRGSFDMKSYTIAQLLALLDTATLGIPTRSVRLLATAEEESGSELGLLWLIREHPELFEDAWGVLTEGGLVETRAVGDVKYWAFEFAQRTEIQFTACAQTKERLDALKEDLRTHSWDDVPIRIGPATRTFLERYRASRERSDLRGLLADLDRLERDPAASQELPLVLLLTMRDDAYQSTPQEVDGTWTSTISLHLLPDTDEATARRTLLPEWMLAGVRIQEIPSAKAGGVSALSHPLATTIDRFLQARYPKDASGPFFLSTVKTDARFLRPLDLDVYGWTPFNLVVSNTLRAAAPHEKIDLPGYVFGIDNYRDLLRELVTDNL
ncbi:MAG: M20/M25/M40 family metallo-hydrolase [Thermoanaerobaculia bacterium]|nr:M20/M25/M40 family metallo-hydrolase [Thermoanaerobaculia bacterium]